MPITLAQLQDPIDWQKPEFKAMLKDLQANILKGHGRPATRNVFLTVKTGQAVAARTGLSKLAPLVTSALSQLEETKKFQETGASGGTVVLAFLSRAGYKALSATAAKIPKDASFGGGMAAAGGNLIDPARSTWDQGYRKAAHAMILIADSSQHLCKMEEAKIRTKLGAAWSVLHVEEGQAIHDDAGEGIEHFGYVDGRSQPLMLTDQVQKEKEAAGNPPSLKWSAFLGPAKLALVSDPAGATSESFGSYFVFRKLGQDVAGFKEAELALSKAQMRAAKREGVSPLPDGELAGTMMIGRFEDGTPVVDSPIATGGSPPNNFNYANDPTGNACPLHAHIRKTNPRDGSEVNSIMPRRGIPFGGLEESGNDVGLLFMAYNRNIAEQFEFIQQSWANNPDFPFTGQTHGVDPIIGQTRDRRPDYENCPIAHGNMKRHKGDFQQFVTMRGGEYFFAPSISGLKNLT